MKNTNCNYYVFPALPIDIQSLIKPASPPKVQLLKAVMKLVGDYYQLSEAQITQRCKKVEIAYPRQMVAYLGYVFGWNAHTYNNKEGKFFTTQETISKAILRDRAVVFHSCKMITNGARIYSNYRKDRQMFVNKLRSQGYGFNLSRQKQYLKPSYDD